MLDEVARIFREELRRGPIPDEKQLAGLVQVAEHGRRAALASRDPDPAVDFVLDVGAPLWAEFRRNAFAARQALDELRSKIPNDDWQRLVERNPGLQEAPHGLGKLGDLIFLDPEPKKVRRGPPSDLELYMLAHEVAEQTASAMLAAGHKAPISLTSKTGPVARIGARILAAMLGRTELPPATFMDWVGKSPDVNFRRK
jgi:hypothetical protein